MKLRHLNISHFRGIRELNWFPKGDFLCLIGPGDTCKSTLLDAIELALSPRWNPTFDDSDFFKGDPSNSIVIEATFGELPRRFLSDDRFGLRLRGYSAARLRLQDEPDESDEEVVTIQLRVDSSLEPTWTVVTDRHPEGLHISARERERFGVMRLGNTFERHLGWGRGSALAALTGEVDEHAQLLADAGRYARSTVQPANLPAMGKAATEVASLAQRFGVVPRNQFEPRIDPSSSTTAGALVLHDGAVPARRAGTGTRRLITLAMQRHLTREGGVVLADEIEHGLEPYRLRRLLANLRPPPSGQVQQGSLESGSVILTTHSSVALAELRAHEVRVARVDQTGRMTISEPSSDLQGTLISHAEAFLSRKVLVCEGATELGLVLGLDAYWSQWEMPFASRGLGLANAMGCSKVGGVALDFRSLGYDCLVLADSDAPLDVSPEDLASRGVPAVVWEGGTSTDERIFLDLPWSGVLEAVTLAAEKHSVRDQVGSATGGATVLPANIAEWSQVPDSLQLRQVFSAVAKSKSGSWFRNVRSGKRLGEIVARHLPNIAATDLAIKLMQMRGWIFRDT